MMMESYLDAHHPHGMRLWQTKQAFYPSHIVLRNAMIEQEMCLERTAKIKNLRQVPIDVNTVHKILPYLWPPDFDQYMIEKGNEAWKIAIETLPPNTAKSLILMLLGRPRLKSYFDSLLSQFGFDETRLETRLYEVGLARWTRQLLVEQNEEVAYYKMMNPVASSRCLPLLPDLKHEHNYLNYSNNWLIRCTTKMEPLKLYSLTHKSDEEAFMARMLCVSSTARAGQWAECWAHSLSALDHIPPSKEYQQRFLHDLLCYIGHSAGRCYILSGTVFKALDFARRYTFNLEHPWKRLLVFQDLLVFWGFFTLQEQVFQKGLEIIPPKTDYYYQLLEQHLRALMHQAENILLYQRARQNFHVRCDPGRCKKPLHLKFSYLRVEELIRQIDFWSRLLIEDGVREYYSAYVHIYTALICNPKTTEERLQHMSQGRSYLKSCIARMRRTYERYKDATIVEKHLAKNVLALDSISTPFNESTFMQYNSGACETYFRLLIITMCMGENQHSFTLKGIQKRTIEYHKKTSNNRSYRQDLLSGNADDFCHTPEDTIDDFPRLDICLEKELIDDVAAIRYWKRELPCLLAFANNDPEFSIEPYKKEKKKQKRKQETEEEKVQEEKERKKGKTDFENVNEIQKVSENVPKEQNVAQSEKNLPTSKTFMTCGDNSVQNMYCFGYGISKSRIL